MNEALIWQRGILVCGVCQDRLTAARDVRAVERAQGAFSGRRSWIGCGRGDWAVEVERRDAVLGDEVAVSQFHSYFYLLRRIRSFCGMRGDLWLCGCSGQLPLDAFPPLQGFL